MGLKVVRICDVDEDGLEIEGTALFFLMDSTGTIVSEGFSTAQEAFEEMGQRNDSKPKIK